MILAFDTSNYTTSIAVLDGDDIIVDFRQLIDVKLGARGIRQSDGFFQHMRALDNWLTDNLADYAAQIDAVAASTKPRPLANSYMPVFRAGEIIAKCIAGSLQLPLYCCSHQEGHLFSALRGNVLDAPFLFMHLSGGTTEIHAVSLQNGHYILDCIAETADISVGQLVDRIGVKAGLKFPCGAAMNKLAATSSALKAPPFKYKAAFNLSGYENYFSACLAKTANSELFYHLFETIANIIIDIISNAMQTTGLKRVLLAGGVAENSVLRKKLANWAEQSDVVVYFAKTRLAADNAIGVARYAQQMRR